jgi:hypothetical protein
MSLFKFFRNKKSGNEPIDSKLNENDFDLFKQKYLDYSATQSTNVNVLAIYKVVLAGENVDSDYWGEDHGSNDLIHIFENSFSENDWKDLELDLCNWSYHQLELYAYPQLSPKIIAGRK